MSAARKKELRRPLDTGSGAPHEHVTEEQSARPLDTGSKTPVEFVIWPRDFKLSLEEIDKTDAAIRQIVGPKVAIRKTIGAKGTPKAFIVHWLGTIDEDQAAEIDKLDGVCQPFCQKD